MQNPCGAVGTGTFTAAGWAETALAVTNAVERAKKLMSAIFLSMVSPCGLLVRSGERRAALRVSLQLTKSNRGANGGDQ